MEREDKVLASLNEFTREQLILMIENCIEQNESTRREVVKFIGNNLERFKETNRKEADLSEYDELWSEAGGIIAEFDEYGGGPEEDEETVYDNLKRIVELFKQGKLDEYTKREFIENCLKYYFSGNSGFDDLLIECVFDVCTEKEDWLFVIGKLKKDSSDYSRDLIREIYRKHLKDDEMYLKLRMSDLKHGMDYYDLVTFHLERGNREKAVEIAEQGLKRGESRVIELIEFLLDCYRKRGDYDRTLKLLVMGYKESPYFGRYKEIERFCRKGDWKRVSKKLYGLTSDDSKVKAEIDYYNKDYRKVFDYVKGKRWDFYDWTDWSKWLQKLEPHLPDEILKIYMERIRALIRTKVAKNYHEARCYCEGVKRILLRIKDEKKVWNSFISSLRQNYANLPALQRELKGL